MTESGKKNGMIRAVDPGWVWPPSLVNAVIDEALQREQRGDARLKDALSRLTPFELFDVVHGVADVAVEMSAAKLPR